MRDSTLPTETNESNDGSRFFKRGSRIIELPGLRSDNGIEAEIQGPSGAGTV